jgi:hypothetical protein
MKKKHIVKLTRDVDTTIVFRDANGDIDHETAFTLPAGERVFPSLAEAFAWQCNINTKHGQGTALLGKRNSYGEIVLWQA